MANAKIAGREKMRRVLKVLPEKQRKHLRDAIYEGSQQIVLAQRALAPISPRGSHGHPPGELRRSIIAVMGDVDPPKYAAFKSRKSQAQDPTLVAIITAGNTRVRYAHLVEFGTAPHTNQGIFKGSLHPGTPAQPFFYPGYRSQKNTVKRKIRTAARKAIVEGIR